MATELRIQIDTFDDEGKRVDARHHRVAGRVAQNNEETVTTACGKEVYRVFGSDTYAVTDSPLPKTDLCEEGCFKK